MQFNQPFGKPTFDSRHYNAYYQTIVPSYTVIGEGEVNSVLIPDGSVQMYFIPTLRYDRWPPYTCINNNFNKEQSIESWFIRNITLPISSTINNQYSNPYGDRLSTQLFSPEYNTALLFGPEFCQKFHNDNATSTTDISYFYPSLRQNKILLNNALVQTSTPTANYNVSYDGVNKQCNCKVSFRIEKEPNNCVCLESASAMSVDSVRNKSSDQSVNKKHQRSKRKGHSRKRKGRDHSCECKAGVKSTSDKLVTTYNDRACGNVPRKGRDTQTRQNSKRSDIKTEIWVPIKGKASKSSIDSLKEPCCSKSVCNCSSTSNTDSQ